MKFKDVLIGGLIAALLIFAWIALSEKQKSKLKDKVIQKLAQQNHQLKLAYVELLEKILAFESKITPDVLKDLEELKEKARYLDELVHVELSEVVDLVKNGKGEKAVRDLGKIIENVLRMRAEKDENFKKKPTLHNLIEHAGVCNWLNSSEVSVANHIRDLRNEESHQLAVRKPSHEIGFAIFGGIKLIYTLYMDMRTNER
jgi:hypothetical protein